jgi:hypothetical protein
MASDYYVVLTVADHEQNGFVALARWPRMHEAQARAFIEEQDSAVDDESEPDINSASFTFILDLVQGNGDLIDCGNRCLPTQVAMSLAPEQVRWWLDKRPDPDSLIAAEPALITDTGRASLSTVEGGRDGG